MKKFLLVCIVSSMLVSMSACSNTQNSADISPSSSPDTQSTAYATEGSFSLKDDFTYETDDSYRPDETASNLIAEAKSIFSLAGYDADFKNVEIGSQEDEWNFRSLYKISVKNGDKTINAYFRKDNGNFVKFDSGYVVSDNAATLYPADEVDLLLEKADEYYKNLPVTQGYVLTGYQTDFSGPDWQVDYSRKIDVPEYDKPVYNYAEHVRMRISATDGKLLSVNVFDTPLLEKDTDQTQITRDQALAASGLDNSLLKSAVIGCYTLRNEGYARLCYVLTYEYTSSSNVCDTCTVYIDLYDGVQIGYESC